MIKKYILIIFLLFQFLACKTEDVISEEIVNINLTISVPQSAGVTFKASFTEISNDLILESGFLISSQPNSSFENSIILSGVINNNEFENITNTDLVYNNQYFVKAYIQTKSSEIFYSDEKHFVSLGSKAPIVKSVDKAHLLDTITIKGDYFTEKRNNIKVLFGNQASKILSSNDTIIKCIVPENIKEFNPILELTVYEKKTMYKGFSLFTPTITSISSLQATFREEIIIYGNHFDITPSKNKVFFGNIEAPIISADRNMLKVIVPDNLEKSIEKIKIVTQLQDVICENNFQLTTPIISFVEQDVYSRQDIVILGENFHPIKNKNIVSFEGVNVDITSGDTKTLNTKIPYGPFPRKKAIVKVKLLDITLEYDIELNILDKWTMVSNDLPMRYYGSMHSSVVANNNAYVIATKKDVYDEYYDRLYLWKFNSEDFSWEQNELPFSIDYYEYWGIVESDGDNIYVYLPSDDNEFWEFNTTTSTWSKKANFIGEKRGGAAHFSINGDIYVGLGVDYEPYTPLSYTDFYKYSPFSNSWTKIADVPLDIWGGTKRAKTACFTINGIGYVTGGAANTGDYDCWSYNPNQNTWSRIADFDSSRSDTSSFVLNDLGYISGGSKTGGSYTSECWQYNPILDRWTQVENIGHIPRGRHFSFTINNKVYIGGGGIYSGGSNGYDLYEYIP